MVEFTYNNSKNARRGHTVVELDCDYHPRVFFKDKCNAYSRSFSNKRLAMELRELMNIYHQNLLHVEDLQKRAHDKKLKLQSYILSEKV